MSALTKSNRDSLSTEDLIELEDQLKEAIRLKKKIWEENNREVENRVGDKKQVVNRKILKTVSIVITNMNLINPRGKGE